LPLVDIPDEAYPLPERRDSVDEWHQRHERAALLRAQDLSWEEVAEEIGVTPGTARNYTDIDGFEDVISHLEAVVRQKRIEQSELETLEVVTEYKPKVLEALAEAALGGDDGDPDPHAAEKFLKAIGFTQKNAALAEVLAGQKQSASDETGDIIVDRSLEGDAS
jgi:hypothetical protein